MSGKCPAEASVAIAIPSLGSIPFWETWRGRADSEWLQAHHIKLLNEEAVKKLKGQDSRQDAARKREGEGDESSEPEAASLAEDAEQFADAPKEEVARSIGKLL